MENKELPWPIMITGAAGLLGHALVPQLRAIAPNIESLILTDLAGHDFANSATLGPKVSPLDVTDETAVKKYVAALRPGAIIHLAAYTNVDGCESHRDEAERLNADAAGFVARAAANAGALIVYISTDFVFDGAKNAPYVEDDLPRPASVYGQTKLKGERAVMSAIDRHLIVRTAWLYGAGGRNFVDTICDLARSRGEVRVVSDQVGCPTWNHDLAGAIISLLRAQAVGTYHACGRGEATWYDLAVAATALRKINATVRPVSTREFNRLSTSTEASGQEARTVPAPRPASSVMSCEKLRHDAGFAFPHWRHSLEAYIAEDTEGEK